MPNWCHNRYAVQGKMGALIQFKNWIEGLYPTPRYHLALEHSKKFFILGATGYFLPTYFPPRPTSFDILFPFSIGEPTMENQAYTEWLELLSTDGFELNDENSRRISNLFYTAGGHFVLWDDLTIEQQQMAECIMSVQRYDWYDSHFEKPRPLDVIFNAEPDIPEMGYPGDLYALLPPQLEPLLNGFNGGLTKERRMDFTAKNAYNMNVNRYGTKWPRFLDTEVEIHTETEASMDVQTAWSPPSEYVDGAMMEKFGLIAMSHRFIEEGCAFAGYRDYENIAGRAELTDFADDILTMDWKEEDKKKYGENEEALWENCEQIVVSPDYVKDIYDSTKKLSGLIGVLAFNELEKKE